MAEVKILKNNKDEIEKLLEERSEIALEYIGIQAEGYAILEIETNPRRVDTGLLRNSITYCVTGQAPHITRYHADNPNPDGSYKFGGYDGVLADEDKKAVYIGTNVEYAEYVHDGTSKMQPNRFLKKAAEKHKDEYKQIFEAVLRG